MKPKKKQFKETEAEYEKAMAEDPRYETPEAAEERVNAMWEEEQKKKKNEA